MGRIEKDGFVWPPGRPDGDVTVPSRALPSDAWSVRRVGLQAIERRPAWIGALEASVFGTAREVAAWSVAVASAVDEAACWRCAGPVGPGETDAAGCAWCRPKRLGFGRSVALGRYDGAMRDAIHGLKYHADRAAGTGLGRELGRAILGMLASEGVEPGEVTLVPVPAAFTRRMLRNGGVDHAWTLARAAGRETGARVARCLRRSAGPSQTEVPGSSRAANVRGVFTVRPEWIGSRIGRAVLIDDVRTTGATLSACAKAVSSLVLDEGEGETRSKNMLFRAVRDRVWAGTAAVSVEGQRP